MLFIVSAGNQCLNINEDIELYPTSYLLNNVITVANLRCDGNISRTSNYGKLIDIAAPGSDLISSFPNDKYAYFSGTSFSTTFATGLAAIIYCVAKKEILAKDIKLLIINNSTYNKKLENLVYGGRQINYDKAINAVLDMK